MNQGSKAKATQLHMSKKVPNRGTSPPRTKSCTQKQQAAKKIEKKVPVIYYLSRNGQLEHPHFMEVTLSSPRGLLLRDVMKRLDILRGQGMSNMYSWSAKRSYKTGYVWQDMSEDDLLEPAHGNEYVLKGSRLLESSESFRSYETALSSSYSSSTSKNSSSESFTCSDDSNILANPRKINDSKSSRMSHDEINEYKVYKVETDKDFSKKAANAGTQTDDKGRQNRVEIEEMALPLSKNAGGVSGNLDVEGSADIRDHSAGNDRPSGRMKASVVLMQLISCGSKKDHQENL